MKLLEKFVLAAFALGFSACAPAAVEGKKVALSSLNAFADGSASTAKGVATLVAQTDGKTKIIVSVTGLTKSTKHIGHVHNGACAAQGGVALVLLRLEADANGNASAETTVDTAKLIGSQYVQYHQRDVGADGGIGGGILCGDIK
jgi:hypothetical protein